MRQPTTQVPSTTAGRFSIVSLGQFNGAIEFSDEVALNDTMGIEFKR